MRRPKGGRPRHRTGRREPHRVIRVLTEGAVTEPSYLAQWARHNRGIHLDLAESGMAPLSLVQLARDHHRANRRSRPSGRRGDFDEIWCVFDVDEHPNLAQAIHEARQSDICVALSNPCFELWLILHYEDQYAHIERGKAQLRAQRLGALVGKHLQPNEVETLLATYDDAKRRAKTLRQRHLGNGSEPASNPSTNVWELVERLR